MKFFRRACLAIIPFTCFASLATAQTSDSSEEWWFDVEVIIYDRGQSLATIEEQFEKNQNLLPTQAGLDLLSSVYEPDVEAIYNGLNQCELPEELWFAPLDLTQFGIMQLPMTLEANLEQPPLTAYELWLQSQAPEFMPESDLTALIDTPLIGCKDSLDGYDISLFPQREVTPVVPFAVQYHTSNFAHLLNKDNLELEELSLRIRSERGLTRLLHTAWRQPVAFGRDEATSVRVFGGQNFGVIYDELGHSKRVREPLSLDPAAAQQNKLAVFNSALLKLSNEAGKAEVFEDQLGSNIVENGSTENSNLASDNDIWQIDGTIKVFLQYINRVPYLHIDGDITYRQPVTLNDGSTDTQLVSIPYKQLRRVISTQLHYFDHPMFGMLIEIRRYKTP